MRGQVGLTQVPGGGPGGEGLGLGPSRGVTSSDASDSQPHRGCESPLVPGRSLVSLFSFHSDRRKARPAHARGDTGRPGARACPLVAARL